MGNSADASQPLFLKYCGTSSIRGTLLDGTVPTARIETSMSRCFHAHGIKVTTEERSRWQQESKRESRYQRVKEYGTRICDLRACSMFGERRIEVEL